MVHPIDGGEVIRLPFREFFHRTEESQVDRPLAQPLVEALQRVDVLGPDGVERDVSLCGRSSVPSFRGPLSCACGTTTKNGTQKLPLLTHGSFRAKNPPETVSPETAEQTQERNEPPPFVPTYERDCLKGSPGRTMAGTLRERQSPPTVPHATTRDALPVAPESPGIQGVREALRQPMEPGLIASAIPRRL
jgi:hypothetical protein